MTARELDLLIGTLSLLLAVYEQRVSPPPVIDSPSFTVGFRAGAASSYADVIARLRDLKAEQKAEQGEAAA